MTDSTINQNPEQIARDRIDDRLRAAGWAVQPAAAIDHTAAPGIAVREYQTTVGPADYALFADRKPLGIVEAKPDAWGEKITTVEQQSAGYATAQLKWVKNPPTTAGIRDRQNLNTAGVYVCVHKDTR